MRLSELLKTASISTRLAAKTKREALAELVGLLEGAHGFESRGEILDRVVRREEMMTTGIGNGVAIPHGKARAVDRMAAACGVSPEGIDFESEDGQPARLFVLFVSPENAASLHVRVLSNISRLLKEESVRQEIIDSDNPAELLAAQRAAEGKYLTPTP